MIKINNEYEFQYGKILFKDKNIEISFNEVPPIQIRNTLKRNGFKWSPEEKLWNKEMNLKGIEKMKNFFNIMNNDNYDYKESMKI